MTVVNEYMNVVFKMIYEVLRMLAQACAVYIKNIVNIRFLDSQE